MKNHVIIKRAVVKDSEAVVKILRQAFQEFKEKYTRKAFEATVTTSEEVEQRMNNGIVWLATLGNEPIGTLSGRITANTFYIQGIAVIPAGRGKSIGYLLLKTCEDYARKNDCNELLLSTTPYLKDAIRLYEKFGFNIINEPPYEFFETPLFNMKKLLE